MCQIFRAAIATRPQGSAVPGHSRLPHQRLPLVLLLLVCLPGFLPARHAWAQPAPTEEPVAVIAGASLDRLLQDADYVFASAGAEQVTQLIQGFLANLNDLQGMDRTRPMGAYLFLRPLEHKDPQPVLFFPVANVDDLIGSVRLGNALRLLRTENDDRLTLITEEGEQAVGLRDGYAYLDPVGQGRWLDADLPDPVMLLGDLCDRFDAVLVIRRAGVPEGIIQLAAGAIQSQAREDLRRKPDESEDEHKIRQAVTEALLDVIATFFEEADSITVGLTVSSETRQAAAELQLHTPRGDRMVSLLTSLVAQKTRFAQAVGTPAPFTLASSWNLTPGGQEILRQTLALVRNELHGQIGRADETIRQTADDALDAIDASIESAEWDSFLQIVGGPPNAFVLRGAVQVADHEAIAEGFERFLPFLGESPDVAELEMDVFRHASTSIHRLRPRKLRKRDERLYGSEASFYVAAGQGAVWFALGEEEAMSALVEAMDQAAAAGGTPSAETVASRPLLEVTTHLSDWIGLAPTTGDTDNARLATLAREAFSNADRDRFLVTVEVAPNGLQLKITLDEGYLRLLGLAVAQRLNR